MTIQHPEWLSHILAGPADPEFLASAFPWAGPMIGCPHDPVFHSEGDPWVHTAMVAEELERSVGFSDLPEDMREVLRLGAWFHDVAKPQTTRIEFDEELGRNRVRQPGHAPLGAMIAWQALIDAGYDAVKARDVHQLVFWHQRPTHLVQGHFDAIKPLSSNAMKRVIQFTQDTSHIRWAEMLRLCAADQNGRRVAGIKPALEELELAEIFISELGENAATDLLTQRWTFGNAASRLAFLRSEGATGNPYHVRNEPQGSRVIVMSGLPGAGKNTLIRQNFPDLPTISFDDLRVELHMNQGDNQGKMIQMAFEKVREHLRAGQDFVWNATGLSRRARQKIVGLALDYDARVEIHSIDVPIDLALARNRGRGDKAIPQGALIEMARKREPAFCDEAHLIVSYDAEMRPRPLFEERFAEPLAALSPG